MGRVLMRIRTGLRRLKREAFIARALNHTIVEPLLVAFRQLFVTFCDSLIAARVMIVQVCNDMCDSVSVKNLPRLIVSLTMCAARVTFRCKFPDSSQKSRLSRTFCCIHHCKRHKLHARLPGRRDNDDARPVTPGASGSHPPEGLDQVALSYK